MSLIAKKYQQYDVTTNKDSSYSTTYEVS